MNCKNCEFDFNKIIKNWWDTLNEVIECPECHSKFTIEYDEYWDEKTGEEDSCWWLVSA